MCDCKMNKIHARRIIVRLYSQTKEEEWKVKARTENSE